MKIKIDAVEEIRLIDQLQIISDYIKQESENNEPKVTKKDRGTKIESRGRCYHVSCNKSKTMWNFSIWWGI